MTTNEKTEIALLPEKYRPLSAWGYWWLTILYLLPVIGTIFLIIHSVNSSNINRRSFARSHFCVLILLAALIVASLSLGILGEIYDVLAKL